MVFSIVNHRRVGVVMLHGSCAMSCLFCITENSIAEMTPEETSIVLRVMKERGVESVVFGGGEPLQWRYSLPAVIEEAKSLGLHTQVGTNGVGLTPEVVNKIKADRYVLPLDSIRAEAHDFLRKGYKWHFTLIQKRLEYLKAVGIPFTISTVVCKLNVNDLDGIAEYLLSLYENGAQIHAWHLYNFLPYGRNGRKNGDKLKISLEEYKSVTERVKRMNFPFSVFKRPNMQLSREVDFFWYENGSLKIGSEVWSSEPSS
ncbi:MAG: radical SAM protein [Candidatus Hydrogenedentes bacterium]|nr:radical SAM protein [Candidatus Hydrogenedentota bacterium]